MSYLTDYFKDLTYMDCYLWSMRGDQIMILNCPNLGTVFTNGIQLCGHVDRSEGRWSGVNILSDLYLGICVLAGLHKYYYLDLPEQKIRIYVQRRSC